MTDDDFTYHHCAHWCEMVGIDPDYIVPMVQELAEDGPDSTLAWPTIARCVGARYTDGTPYA